MLEKDLINKVTGLGGVYLGWVLFSQRSTPRHEFEEKSCVYVFNGWDELDPKSLYVGSTMKGIKRPRQHAFAGCDALKNIIRNPASLSDNFVVYFFEFENNERWELLRNEGKVQAALLPWIMPNTHGTRITVFSHEYEPIYISSCHLKIVDRIELPIRLFEILRAETKSPPG